MTEHLNFPADPGAVNDLRISPDIASILITWERPSENEGGEFVTGYEVIHQLNTPDANPIGQVLLDESLTTHRFTNLLPGRAYQIFVRALVEGRRGQPRQVAQSTRQIGGWGTPASQHRWE